MSLEAPGDCESLVLCCPASAFAGKARFLGATPPPSPRALGQHFRARKALSVESHLGAFNLRKGLLKQTLRKDKKGLAISFAEEVPHIFLELHLTDRKTETWRG